MLYKIIVNNKKNKFHQHAEQKIMFVARKKMLKRVVDKKVFFTYMQKQQDIYATIKMRVKTNVVLVVGHQREFLYNKKLLISICDLKTGLNIFSCMSSIAYYPEI